MKYSKYFGAKQHGFIKSESNLAPKGASHLRMKISGVIVPIKFTRSLTDKF
jgi:hypothetical protein